MKGSSVLAGNRLKNFGNVEEDRRLTPKQIPPREAADR